MTLRERKEVVVCWVKEHKTEILISLAVVGGIIYAAREMNNDEKNVDNIDQLISDVHLGENNLLSKCDIAEKIICENVLEINKKNYSDSFTVNGHFRDLPEGYHASEAKIKWANDNGVTLPENQTWVEEYVKNRIAS